MEEDTKNPIAGGFLQARNDTGENTVRVVVPRPDELSRSNQDEAAVRLAQAEHNRTKEGRVTKWPHGPSEGRKQRTALARMGIPKSCQEGVNADYGASIRRAKAWQRVRIREMAKHHGYVSSGVCSLVSSAALALAGSRYMYECASQLTDPKDIKDLLYAAAKLADSSRQNELAAWELCARESVSQKKVDAALEGLPWLVPQQDRPKRGRPSLLALKESEEEAQVIQAKADEAAATAEKLKKADEAAAKAERAAMYARGDYTVDSNGNRLPKRSRDIG